MVCCSLLWSDMCDSSNDISTNNGGCCRGLGRLKLGSRDTAPAQGWQRDGCALCRRVPSSRTVSAVAWVDRPRRVTPRARLSVDACLAAQRRQRLARSVGRKTATSGCVWAPASAACRVRATRSLAGLSSCLAWLPLRGGGVRRRGARRRRGEEVSRDVCETVGGASRFLHPLGSC